MSLVVDFLLSKSYYRGFITSKLGIKLGILVLASFNEIDSICHPELKEIELPSELVEYGKDVFFKLAKRKFDPDLTLYPWKVALQKKINEKLQKKEFVPLPPSKIDPEEIKNLTENLKKNLKKMIQNSLK